ncbi:MAG: APC family permease [Myxococcota bacterium]
MSDSGLPPGLSPRGPSDPERPSLQRTIGLLGLTFVAVGGIIGSGWLFAPLLTSRLAGPAALISWGIGGIAMLSLALCFAEVVGILPVAGGIARIPHFTHGDVTSAVLGWSAWVGYNTAAPIETIAMLQYLDRYLPWLFHGDVTQGSLSWAGAAVAIGILGFFVVINAYGAEVFSKANAALTWVKLAIPLIIAIAILAARFEPANFNAGGGFAPYGMKGIFAAVSAGGILFALIGFRHAVDMAGEVKRPKVTIPAALTLSLIICLGIYGLLQIAFVGAIDPSLLKDGWANLEFDHTLGPMAGVAAALGIGWITITLNAGAIVSPFGGGLVATGSMARLGYALGQNRVFPTYFEHLSPRGVPFRCLVLNFILGGAVVLFVPFDEAVALNGAAITLSFAAGPLAVLALRRQYPTAKRAFQLPAAQFIAPFSFIVATLIVYWSGWETTWRLGLIVAAGIVVFAIRMRQEGVHRHELDLREASWLLPYLAGIGIVSYLGDFEGGRGLLVYPWDMGAVSIVALAVFGYGHHVRLSNAKAAVYRKRWGTDLPPETVPL